MSKELLLVVEAVANEKEIDRELIFQAMETALETSTRKRHNQNWQVRVAINRATGEYDTFRQWIIVSDDAEMDNEEAEIKLMEALAKEEGVELGGVIEEPMESIAFGRIAAQTAKQVIIQKVREAEREKMVKSFESKLGKLVNGTVKRVMREAILLDLGQHAEGILPKSELLPHESYRINDRVKVVLAEIDRESRFPQLVLSRTHNNMILELFKLEVPEIAEEVIEIKAIARDPGYRAKIAVKTNDGRMDPVGACVGVRGSRVQAITDELSGERIDVVLWNEDEAKFVINAMSPAEVVSIVVDEDNHSMQVAVKEEALSQAIGKNGQNIRLASELTGWKLNVMSAEEAQSAQENESRKLVKLFVDQLSVDESIAEILTEEGFTSLEEVAYVPLDEMLEIEEFDEDLVNELRERAKNALLSIAFGAGPTATPAEDLLNMKGMDEETAKALSQIGVITMEDLAEQAVDDLLEIEGMTNERAAELIMTAREPWFQEMNDQ